MHHETVMTFPMGRERFFASVTEKIVLTVFLISLLSVILYPVHDPDVFWHLKTGEWIWQHHALPERDPFSFTLNEFEYDNSPRIPSLLKGYWLSQLIIYGFYSSFGITGIIIFRCGIYLGICYMLFYWLKRRKISSLSALFFLLPSLLTIWCFQGERPNTLSYLMALVIAYLLDESSRGNVSISRLMPFIMLLWANMHGGFLLGEILIAVYLLSMFYSIIICKESWQKYIVQIVLLAISMTLPFFAGHTQGIVKTMISGDSGLFFAAITENLSPLYKARMGDYSSLSILSIMTLMMTVVFRRLSFEYMIISVFLLAISLHSVRYIPFLVFITTPAIAIGWSSKPGFDLKDKYFRRAICAAIIVVTIFIGALGFRKSLFIKGVLSSYYPDDQMHYMSTYNLGGNLFNYYSWGGYLIYKLYPANKVFIDPRIMSIEVFNKYDTISNGYEGSVSKSDGWKAILSEYNINIILIPTFSEADGRLIILAKRLIEDPEWSLVSVGMESPSLLFLRKTADNAEFIDKHAIQKEKAYYKALEDLANKSEFRRHWRNSVQMGIVCIAINRYNDAVAYFEQATEKNHGLAETVVGKVLADLKQGTFTGLNDAELYKIWTL